MSPRDPLPQRRPGAIDEMAGEWSVRRTAGLSADETAQWQAWLAADVRHAAAFARAEQMAALLRQPRLTGTAPLVLGVLRARQQARQRSRRRALGWSAAGLGLAALAVFGSVRHFHPVELPAVVMSPPTVVVRPDRQSLPDGSIVHLNAGSEIRVAFTGGDRTVELLRGEALFTVVADAARPFVVVAAGIAVKAVGTEFSVRRAESGVDVLVTEGRVAVAPMRADERASGEIPVAAVETGPVPLLLGAGSRVTVPLSGQALAGVAAQPVSPEEISGALAWRDQRIEFTGTPVGEALATFNVGNRVQLELADRSLATQRISGIFWRDDPEAFARLLELSLGWSAVRIAPDRIVLRRGP